MRAKEELRSSQQRVITSMYEGVWADGGYTAGQFILPMGAGKTASALTAFVELKADGFANDMFVIAPKRVSMMVWPEEPRLWQHLCHLKVVFVGGTERQRLAALASPADVYAVTQDNTQWFVEWCQTQHPDRFSRTVLCIDESSRFKNPRGKRGKELFSFLYKNPKAFMAIWELTGTPRPNGWEDQFMPLKLATRGKLWGKSFDQWRDKHFYPLDYNGYKFAMHPEHQVQIVEDINRATITIPPEDLGVPELNDGPDLIAWVDMPPEIEATYKEMQRHLVAEMRKGTVTAANMAVASGKLAQIAQGFLYHGSGSAKETERIHDVKMERLLELIEEAGGEQVVVAYDFQADLARLQIEFPGLAWLGESDAKDIEIVRRWNRGDLDLLALHPASAGHGLNLQHGGRQLFHYCLHWSAELYDQLLKRFHRPGQTLPVFSRPILMKGTVDELKYSRVHDKISAQEAFNRLLKEV